MNDAVAVAEASLEEVRRSCDVDALLDADERSRAARFRSSDARDRFVAGRALLKTLLGASLRRLPSAIRLRVEATGQPVLLEPDSGVHVSISHAGERVVVACASREVGVDIERLRPLPGALDLARRFFDASEAASLEREPVAHRSEAFLALWTKKEALLKARGLGLAGGLAAPLEASGAFMVRALRVAEGYVGAIAARGHDWSVAGR
jgi:4'-phosphopantetheinyl transferase